MRQLRNSSGKWCLPHRECCPVTVAYALGFSASTSRLPALNLSTGIITVLLNHTLQILLHYSTHKVFTGWWTFLFFTSLITRTQLTGNCTSVSPINAWSDMRETLLPMVLLLLRHCWNAWRHCWRGHITPPHSCHPSVYSCCLVMGDMFTSALHSDGRRATLVVPKTLLSSTVA
jgi:hypothetical protein